MSDAFIGEVRAFAISFVPVDWYACDGRSLSVNQYPELYAVIGNIYGGNQQNFLLPNLQGRAVIGAGNGPGLSPQTLGVVPTDAASGVQLTQAQLPSHTHTITTQLAGEKVMPTAFKTTPTANVSYPSRYFDIAAPASPTAPITYPTCHPTPPTGTSTPTSPTAPVSMSPTQLLPYAGSGGLHENRQPFVTLQLCICYSGIFPLRP